jgi:hypothetical protein
MRRRRPSKVEEANVTTRAARDLIEEIEGLRAEMRVKLKQLEEAKGVPFTLKQGYKYALQEPIDERFSQDLLERICKRLKEAMEQLLSVTTTRTTSSQEM